MIYVKYAARGTAQLVRYARKNEHHPGPHPEAT